MIFESKVPSEVRQNGWVLEYLLLEMVAKEKQVKKFDNLYIAAIRKNFLQMDKPDFLNYLIEDIDSNNASGSNHVNWFNYEKMKELLISSGFRSVRRSAFAQSQFPPMQEIPLFDGLLPGISLYVEATI
jgi:hypothetical protein